MLAGSSSVLIAAAERVPNEEAIALSPQVGWLMLVCAVCAAGLFALNREGWRRLWLAAEDPRPMAVFRICFGVMVLCNINGLSDQWIYLFTDEGIFLTDVARYVRAREQFSGFGNGLGDDPYGFFDWAAFMTWLKGTNYSLLLFWDTPTAFYVHIVAFELATLALILGLWTPVTKWVAWFLFHSIIMRNALFWEGTENVYRTFYFYLCLSRCGQAYSIDNWLRCRKLRRQGRLSEPGGPGNGAGVAPSAAHPKGLEAIYRLIPRWPRLLVILQIACIYCYTGVVKNGSVWRNGDAFYYAVNLDHFYRFPPQAISAVLGTTLFRINTHVTHIWEMMFPLVVLGLVLRWARREMIPPVGLAAAKPRLHRVLNWALWIGLGVFAMLTAYVTYPVHYREPRNGPTTEQVQWMFAAGWLVGMALVGWFFYRLRNRPFVIKIRGHEFVIDQDWFCAWFLGRRIWLVLGITFHVHLIIMMNIGWFSPALLTGYFCFLNGSELSGIGTVVAQRLHQWLSRPKWLVPAMGGAGAGLFALSIWVVPMALFLAVPLLGLAVGYVLVPARLRTGGSPLPAEDPTLPHLHRDDWRFPPILIWGALLVAVGGIFGQVYGEIAYGWFLTGIAAACLGAGLMARARARTADDDPRQPWAYGPYGRTVANLLVIYQTVGVACWVLPDKDSLKNWRTETHKPFKWWLRVTQTTQGWKMFAPNPPRGNMFMKVLVTDKDGETWDLNTDVYHPDKRPIPWMWYSRERKQNRRTMGAEGGKGSWYAKWHARYICRQWQADHEGELPEKVELVKVTYPIPSPQWVAKHGAYDPMKRLEKKGKQTSQYTATCATEVDAQLPDRLADRMGVPQSDQVRRWSRLRGKKRAWERKLEREKKKKEREEAAAAKDSGKAEAPVKAEAKATPKVEATPAGDPPTRDKTAPARGSGE